MCPSEHPKGTVSKSQRESASSKLQGERQRRPGKTSNTQLEWQEFRQNVLEKLDSHFDDIRKLYDIAREQERMIGQMFEMLRGKADNSTTKARPDGVQGLLIPSGDGAGLFGLLPTGGEADRGAKKPTTGRYGA